MGFEPQDSEWQEEYDEFHDDSVETLECPHCGREVYEDTDKCPHCGEWIMPLAARASSKSRIWIVGAILALLAMLVFLIRSL